MRRSQQSSRHTNRIVLRVRSRLQKPFKAVEYRTVSPEAALANKCPLSGRLRGAISEATAVTSNRAAELLWASRDRLSEGRQIGLRMPST